MHGHVDPSTFAAAQGERLSEFNRHQAKHKEWNEQDAVLMLCEVAVSSMQSQAPDVMARFDSDGLAAAMASYLLARQR